GTKHMRLEVSYPYEVWERLMAALAAAQQQGQGQPAPPSAPVGVGYAKRLATSLWQQHYREDAPQWEPCEDLMGLLSQIDNMVSGLTRAAQQPTAEAQGVVDEGSRSVTRQLLHWGGVPVHVTGTVTTSPGNWSLIDAALDAQHQEP